MWPGTRVTDRQVSRRDVVDQVAHTLQMAWTALIAPDWPQLQAIIERDVVHRAGQLTRVGWAGAVTGLHRTVVWHNATVEIRERPNDQVRFDGRGLLFVPSVFIYPGIGIYLDPRGDQRWSTPPGAAPRSGRPSRAHPDHCAGCWEHQGQSAGYS